MISAGELTDGWAADDGAALVYAGETLSEVVSSRPEVAGYRVTKAAGQQVAEERIPVRYLGLGAVPGPAPSVLE